jgi:hypothetical protein
MRGTTAVTNPTDWRPPSRRTVTQAKPPDNDVDHRTEMDSQADQCCVGDNALILYEWPGYSVKVRLLGMYCLSTDRDGCGMLR